MTTTTGSGWGDWDNAEHAEQDATSTSAAALAAVAGDTPSGWKDWKQPGGGHGDSGSPMPVVVRCPITWDASAAQITLPDTQKPGYSVTFGVALDGGLAAGELPTALNARLLDGTTVLVKLTGSGPVAHGPEYTPPAWPGGKKTPVAVPPGTPYVTLVVHPASGGGMGGGQPVTDPPGMKGGMR